MAATFTCVFCESNTGRAGWAMLRKLAHQRGRSPREQALQLVRYALDRALDGEDVELSQVRLQALLESDLVA